MTDLPTPSGSTETLAFKSYPVRHVMLAGVPWFYLRDIVAILHPAPTDPDSIVEGWWFPEFTHAVHEDPADGSVAIVSPIGAWWASMLIPHKFADGVAAWTRREAKRLCPSPAADDPAMFLTLMPGPLMPPKPSRFSGRLAEWEELNDASGNLGYVRADRVCLFRAPEQVARMLDGSN